MVVLKYFSSSCFLERETILCPSPSFSHCILSELVVVASSLVCRPLSEIHSQQTCGVSNCEKLLSNNPALPVGETVIKQQILKSVMEFVD